MKVRVKEMKKLRSALTVMTLSALALALSSPAAQAQSDGSSDGSGGPAIIINSDPGVGQVLPQQIFVPRVGESFGSPASIANPSVFPISPIVPVSPYRWLGAYGTPALSGVRMGLGLGGIGGGFGVYGIPYGGYVPGLGGIGGFGTGFIPGVPGLGE